MMPEKDCIFTIVNYFLFKYLKVNSKYNVEISVDLT